MIFYVTKQCQQVDEKCFNFVQKTGRVTPAAFERFVTDDNWAHSRSIESVAISLKLITVNHIS